MSSLEGKLEQPEQGQGQRARAKLSQLKAMRGFTVIEADKSGPTVVRVMPMDRASRWVRITGGQDGWFEILKVF